jgi:16S rRNA (guanine1207-N2)-methyltransferase
VTDPDEAGSEPDHYYTERPRSASRPRELRFLYRGAILVFQVDTGVFGSSGLDPGTSLLIEALLPNRTDRILDLGCGWGAIGVAAAKAAPEGHVVMTDVNRRAVSLSRRNLRRNEIRNAEVRPGSLYEPVEGEKFDLIVSNPPYHVGRPTILKLFEEAPAHLSPGGTLLVVGKGSQGIRFYQGWLEEHWPGTVEVAGRGSGYRVLTARLDPAIRKA